MALGRIEVVGHGRWICVWTYLGKQRNGRVVLSRPLGVHTLERFFVFVVCGRQYHHELDLWLSLEQRVDRRSDESGVPMGRRGVGKRSYALLRHPVQFRIDLD